MMNPAFRCVSLTLLFAPACLLQKQLDQEPAADSADSDDGDVSFSGGGQTTSDADTSGDWIPMEQAVDAMAVARCAALFACECNQWHDSPAWPASDICEADMVNYFQEQFELGLSAGLAYDGECVNRYIEYYQGSLPYDPAFSDCSPLTPESGREYRELLECPFFRGDGQPGDTCVGDVIIAPGVDSCAPGSMCALAECVAIGGIDAPCTGGDINADCQLGLFCDPGTSRCSPRAAIGEACGETRPCDLDGYCRAGVCEAVGAPEAECSHDFECASQHCLDGACAPVAHGCSPWAKEVTACEATSTEISEFLVANSGCTTDEDCVLVDAACHPESTCNTVALSADYDPQHWAALADALAESCAPCDDPACGAWADCVGGTCTTRL